MEKEEVPEIKKKQTKEFQLVNVPTQYVTAIETPEGENISIEQGIVLVLNEINQIKLILGNA